ncbi:MAG: AsnC family transcriptional regulator, partial [Aciduliprofundum sp.]
MKLDDLDFKILDLMNENPRLSYRKIAEAVGSTTPTVK